MTRKRALIVIDVQNEYFSGNLPIEYPPVAGSLANIGRAMDAARARGMPVIVVQHSSPSGSPVFAPGTPGWRLHEEIARHPCDHHVEKRSASAFAGTDLAAWIAGHGIGTLTVAGYMTHNCDAATIHQAVQMGLEVEFLADASGSLPYGNQAGHASAEEIHRVSCVVFQSNFAAVASTAQWIESLESGEALPRHNPFLSNQQARASSSHG